MKFSASDRVVDGIILSLFHGFMHRPTAWKWILYIYGDALPWLLFSFLVDFQAFFLGISIASPVVTEKPVPSYNWNFLYSSCVFLLFRCSLASPSGRIVPQLPRELSWFPHPEVTSLPYA